MPKAASAEAADADPESDCTTGEAGGGTAAGDWWAFEAAVEVVALVGVVFLVLVVVLALSPAAGRALARTPPVGVNGLFLSSTGVDFGACEIECAEPAALPHLDANSVCEFQCEFQ